MKPLTFRCTIQINITKSCCILLKQNICTQKYTTFILPNFVPCFIRSLFDLQLPNMQRMHQYITPPLSKHSPLFSNSCSSHTYHWNMLHISNNSRDRQCLSVCVCVYMCVYVYVYSETHDRIATTQQCRLITTKALKCQHRNKEKRLWYSWYFK